MTRYDSISTYKICCLQRQYLKSNQLISESKKRPQPIDLYCHIIIWLKFVGSPRVCGKNLVIALFAVPVLGSPPRVREKHLSQRLKRIHTGITPACAGKTRQVKTCNFKNRDHPRVCGKNVINRLVNLLSLGSPPRVREKLASTITP